MCVQGQIDLERDIKETSGELEVFYFDRSMFYIGISICQNSYTRFMHLKVYHYCCKKKLNVELLFIGLVFLNGIRLAIPKLLIL